MKTIVIMVIMVVQTNSDGSNIEWSVELFLELVFGSFLGWGGGHLRGGGCFDKVVGHRVSSRI